MATTPVAGLPYPALTDAPNGPSQLQALATTIDTAVTAKTWTLTLSATVTAPTLGSGGTIGGYYAKLGEILTGYGVIVFGTSGTSGSGNWVFTLPAPVHVLMKPGQVVGSFGWTHGGAETFYSLYLQTGLSSCSAATAAGAPFSNTTAGTPASGDLGLLTFNYLTA